MGSAGVSINQELDRINNLINQAKKMGMTVIGCHTEGQARRGGYDEDIINQIAPKMNYLIVRNDGNTDGIFNKIAEKGNIPITFIDKTSELVQVFAAMFK
jgi:nitrogen regulatory protein PII